MLPRRVFYMGNHNSSRVTVHSVRFLKSGVDAASVQLNLSFYQCWLRVASHLSLRLFFFFFFLSWSCSLTQWGNERCWLKSDRCTSCKLEPENAPFSTRVNAETGAFCYWAVRPCGCEKAFFSARFGRKQKMRCARVQYSLSTLLPPVLPAVQR